MTPLADTKTLTVMGAIKEALDEALAADPRVFLLGEDLADPGGGVSGVTSGLSTKYGRQRVLDIPDPDDELVKYLPSRSPEGEESGFSQQRAEALSR